MNPFTLQYHKKAFFCKRHNHTDCKKSGQRLRIPILALLLMVSVYENEMETENFNVFFGCLVVNCTEKIHLYGLYMGQNGIYLMEQCS